MAVKTDIRKQQEGKTRLSPSSMTRGDFFRWDSRKRSDASSEDVRILPSSAGMFPILATYRGTTYLALLR